MEEQQTGSSKGGVLMKGTDHSERVSVKMVEEDTKKGEQFSAQPKKIAKKTARVRKASHRPRRRS